MINKLNWKEFVDFWKQFYNPRHYLDEKYYFPYILPINRALRSEDLENLFEWKNGVPLSKSKKKVLELAINNLNEINNFRKLKKISEKDIKDFFNFVSKKIVKSGIVWKIFILHISRPKELPMIDKFTFVAVNFLKTGKIINFSKEYQNIEEYLEFRKFFNKIIEKSRLNYREIDKALMAFGQFLDKPQRFLNESKF